MLPSGVVAMPYGPEPGALNTPDLPNSRIRVAVKTTLSCKPHNAAMVEGSRIQVSITAILGGQRKHLHFFCHRVRRRTMAFKPPSVIHGAPSGPTMTPCGAGFRPSAMLCVLPGPGIPESSQLARPLSCIPDSPIRRRCNVMWL